MRKILFIFFLSFTLSSFSQSSLDVKTITLHNGMTVWINTDHTQPKVYGAVVVRAGAKDCPNSGIAHYLEHLLFKGTQKIGTVDYKSEKPWLDSISNQYDILSKTDDAQKRMAIQRHINELSLKAANYAIPNEFSNLISLYGGTGLNAYTSFDETVFHNTFSPQYIRQWCELNSERLKDPVFRLFQGELETVYEEKNMYSDNLLTSTAEKAQQFALAGTPYAYPILGATDSLKNPRLSEMMQFFKMYYVPENMGLVLSGDLDADSIVNLLEETFGSLKARNSNTLRSFSASSKSTLQDFRNVGTLRLKVPVPIVKIGAFAWQTPDERSRDYAAFKVMSSMLINDDKTGLIDSLASNGKLMFAAGMGYDFKDFSAWGFGFVPRIPFGSRKKAEKLCFQQIEKLKKGDFTESALDAEKLTLSRKQFQALETISGRSAAMINAFSHGLTWNERKSLGRDIASVTKEDIMRVARKYLNDDSLKIVKKFGSYPKEHLSQPGYKPVKPNNAGKSSDYAKTLAEMPVENVSPKFVDLNKDANHTALSPLVNLYSVRNKENNIFTLQLIFRYGTRNDKRLSVLPDYLDEIGTEQHDKHQFGKLLRQNGATLDASASASSFTLTLTGLDSRFKESVALLHEFLTSPKADKKKYKDLIKSMRLEESTFFKNNRSIASAVMQKIAKGNNSQYLNRTSANDLKKISGEELVSLFKTLQTWQTDIVYCGSFDAKDIENTVKDGINIEEVSHAWKFVGQELEPVKENTVYIYDNPKARQTVVGSYQQIAPMETSQTRSRFALWGNYFGGGMQSVTFQEIREFRSLAYYAHGQLLTPDFKLQPKAPCGYITLSGTQADKAMQTAMLVDSLIDNMPLNSANIAPAKQSLINSINNSYPSFRSMGANIAGLRLREYEYDPSRDIYEGLLPLGINDVRDFYKNNIKSKSRSIIIVGDKKKLDLQKLSTIGRIVILSKNDIYHQ